MQARGGNRGIAPTHSQFGIRWWWVATLHSVAIPTVTSQPVQYTLGITPQAYVLSCTVVGTDS